MNKPLVVTAAAVAAAVLTGPKRVVVLVAAAVALLSGCSTVPGRFDNRVVRTLAGDRAFVNILFGPLGVTLEVSERDAAAVAPAGSVRAP